MIAAVAGAAVSAVLLGLFARVEPPFHLLGFVALAPWLLGMDRARSLPAAVLSALVLAVGFTASGFSWFPATIAAYAHVSPALAWAITVVVAPLLLQPQLVVVAIARHLARRRAWLVTALAWTGAEWALPKLFRDTLGYGLHPSETLRQAADVGGVRGLTFLLVLGNAALVTRRRGPLAVAAAALLLACGYGALRLQAVRAETADARVVRAGVVQAAITRYEKLAATAGGYDAITGILAAHFELSERLLSEGPLDLLVWPETTYPTAFGAPRGPDAAELDRAIAGFAGTRRTPLLFGAFEREGDRDYNAAFLLAPSGERSLELDSYRKTLLFPLTERIPPWLDGPRLRRALPWAGHFTPGPGPRALPLGAIRLGPLICYEAVDPGHAAATVRAGADLLVTLSNDSWFTSDAAPRLHLVMAAFRSIETRRAQLRATNSGMSALILPDGTLRETTAFGARAAFRADAPLLSDRTLVVAWGDWLGPAALLLLIPAAALGARRSRARPRGSAARRG